MSRPFDRDLYMRAWHFASTRHGAQLVKGTQMPYITHVGAVAMEVLATLAVEEIADPDLAVACALLHDTIEDAEVKQSEIAAEFGAGIADGVLALSKDKQLGADEAMADSLRRIKLQPREVWIVKLADRAVNMSPAPVNWTVEKRRAYLRAASEILDALGSASVSLAARLREKMARYEAALTGG